MTEISLLQQAKQGNPQAIAFMMNRSLQKKGITATVDLNQGHLEIMLDGEQTPPESVANWVNKGISSLNTEAIYRLSVYGRAAGCHFAAWCHEFKLREAPLGQPIVSEIFTSPATAANQSLVLTFATEEGVRTLDLVQFSA